MRDTVRLLGRSTETRVYDHYVIRLKSNTFQVMVS